MAEEEDCILVEVQRPKKHKTSTASWTFVPAELPEDDSEKEMGEMKSFELSDIIQADLKSILSEKGRQGKAGL